MANGRLLIKEYIKYDPTQDGYLPSSKLWGLHYIEYIYDKNNKLISKQLKDNIIGQKNVEDIAKFHREHPDWY